MTMSHSPSEPAPTISLHSKLILEARLERLAERVDRLAKRVDQLAEKFAEEA